MARKMQTRVERKFKVPLFEGQAWETRHEGRFMREATKHQIALDRKGR